MLNDLERQILVPSRRRGVLAPHRDAARVLRHRAEPGRLRHPPEAAPQRRDVEEVIDGLRAKSGGDAAGAPHRFRAAPRGQHRRSDGRRRRSRSTSGSTATTRRCSSTKAREAAAMLRRRFGGRRRLRRHHDRGPGADDPRPPGPGRRGRGSLARFGLTAEDVHAEVEPALTGTVAGDVRIGERLYDLRVFARRRREVSAAMRDPDAGRRARAALRARDGLDGSAGGRDPAREPADLRRRDRAPRRTGPRRRDRGDPQQARAQPAPAARHVDLDFGGLYEQQQSSFKGLLGVLLGGLLPRRDRPALRVRRLAGAAPDGR